MRASHVLISVLISAGCLSAQQASLTGPVEAYTFDAPTRSLRAVFGLPGAASFGPALRDNLDFGSVAPGQNYGLGFERGQYLLISGLGSPLLSTRTLTGVTAQPDAVAWSADGTFAILYSRAGNWLQSLSGLPAAPTAGPRFDVSSLGGVVTSVAVDAHGKQIAAGISGDAGAVYLSADAENFTSLHSLAKPIALSFASDGRTLYALDGSVPQVVSVNVGDHGYQTIGLHGLTAPVAIQVLTDSQNRQVLYVAAASDRLLRILDIASQQILTDVPLGFEATRLDQFGSNSFVVASRSQAARPLWLFTNSPQPTAYFVPAVQLRPGNNRRVMIVGGAR